MFGDCLKIFGDCLKILGTSVLLCISMHRESGYDSEVDPIMKLIWSKVCITIYITISITHTPLVFCACLFSFCKRGLSIQGACIVKKACLINGACLIKGTCIAKGVLDPWLSVALLCGHVLLCMGGEGQNCFCMATKNNFGGWHALLHCVCVCVCVCVENGPKTQAMMVGATEN